MKVLTTITVVAAALAGLSGCVVAPDRGYRDHDHDRYYDHRYQDRDINVHSGERRSEDGDHAGGTGTPD